MKSKLALAAAAAIACTFAAPAASQQAGRAIVQIYHVAPGQHVSFLKWLNQQDQVAAAAGVAKGQLYAHTDGDSWDYLVISPATTEAQDAAIDAAGKKMGINMMRGGIELRKYITSHTDTFTRGPTTAADYLAAVGEK
jgi:membrane-bound lytic murein transglycosylase B